MSAAPFDTGLVVARLRERLVKKGGLRLVGGSADMAAVRQLQDYPAPCAYVLLGREIAEETKSGISARNQQTPIAQRVRVTFAVTMVFQNHRQLEGDALRNELRDRIGVVRDQLLGWTPPVSGGRACQLLQGDLLSYDAGTALWTDAWQTHHTIKPEIAP